MGLGDGVTWGGVTQDGNTWAGVTRDGVTWGGDGELGQFHRRDVATRKAT